MLDVANRIVAGLSTAFGAGRVPLTVLEPCPGRETGGGEGGEVRAALLPTRRGEADWMAGRVADACERRRDAHGERCPDEGCEGWHEAAVLCRRRSQFGLLRQALERRGVPVEVIGLGGLLDAPEVADLVAVLRVLHDATANAAVARLLTGPRWRIGLRDLDALGRRAAVLVRDPRHSPGPAEPLPLQLGGDEAEVGSLSDALERLDDSQLARLAPLSPEAVSRLRRLRGELTALRRRIDQPLPDLIADVERTIGLDIELEATPDRLRQGRRANVLAFLDVAADFVGLDGHTDLGAFLASLDAAEKAEDGYDLGVPSAADTVKLMTVHAAKGLEWDVVGVPGLSRGIFPSNRGTSPWPWRPEALPGELRGDRADSAGVDRSQPGRMHQLSRRLQGRAGGRGTATRVCRGDPGPRSTAVLRVLVVGHREAGRSSRGRSSSRRSRVRAAMARGWSRPRPQNPWRATKTRCWQPIAWQMCGGRRRPSSPRGCDGPRPRFAAGSRRPVTTTRIRPAK